MHKQKRQLMWVIWVILTLLITFYFGYKMTIDTDKSQFLIGETSHGHFQIEMACTACHTEAFGGPEAIQKACVNCHGNELAEADDSHPKKKFIDPRNADQLAILDARYCVSCHTEHKEDQTHQMGLSLPKDYCFHCHKNITEERPSHAELAFDSCATAGCHNYHDNRALYEAFLVKHSNEPWLSIMPNTPETNHVKLSQLKTGQALKDFAQNIATPEKSAEHPEITEAWSHSSHAQSGIECGGCHLTENEDWIAAPDINNCQQCHQEEAKEFLASKHGMRLSQGLSPVKPQDSKLTFTTSSAHQEQGCNTCHQAHGFERQAASVDACLGCHDDEHSRSFWDSPHGQLTKSAFAKNTPITEAVTCATCHLPKIERKTGSETTFGVAHNQNDFLRPNEKMIRPVCMQCHGLEFSIDALADEILIKNNFTGKPSKHIPSIDWATDNAKDKK